MNTLNTKLLHALKQLLRFRVVLFVMLVAVVYVSLIWHIDTLKNARPDQGSVVSQIKSSTNIDPATINKIKQLQDNSVSVQALFNQARQNPFHE